MALLLVAAFHKWIKVIKQKNTFGGKKRWVNYNPSLEEICNLLEKVNRFVFKSMQYVNTHANHEETGPYLDLYAQTSIVSFKKFP